MLKFVQKIIFILHRDGQTKAISVMKHKKILALGRNKASQCGPSFDS